MVDRIHKIESDSLRVQRKENASDDSEKRRGEDQGRDKEEHDEFAPKLDFERWTGDAKSAGQTHPSLWDKKPVAHPGQAEAASPPKESSREDLFEEATTSTITFMRATGLIGTDGRLRWGTISLYAFALIGSVLAVTFLLNALL